MERSYDARFYKTETYKGKSRTTYRVRWSVGGRIRGRTFRTKALADSFRSDLIAAGRKGEAFDMSSGLPMSMARQRSDVSWFDFAQDYVDMKWPDSAAKSRRSRAEALTATTLALLPRGKPCPVDEKTLRRAMMLWAFNTKRRANARPSDIEEAIKWVTDQSPRVSDLDDPAVIRRVLDALATRTDGKPAASNYFSRRRMVLSNAISYAVKELRLLEDNPLKGVELDRTKYKNRGLVDRRSVVNPVQAAALLEAVRETGRTGPRLVAMFAAMYYAALRPEEAVNLREHWLELPHAGGWGTIYLERASPDAGSEWTTSGDRHDDRGLKHRAEDDRREVPAPPALTAILSEHLSKFGTKSGGRLFWSENQPSKPVPTTSYCKIWSLARMSALTAAQAASPLAKRPYDLRHAAVSTWLNAGVPAAQVAEWAGHSVEVLLRVYAACLDGGAAEARRRIEDVLGTSNEATDDGCRDEHEPNDSADSDPRP